MIEANTGEGGKEEMMAVKNAPGKKKWKRSKVDLGPHVKKTSDLRISPSGKVWGVGTYTQPNSMNHAMGFYTFRFNSRGDVRSVEKHPIPLELQLKYKEEDEREEIREKNKRKEGPGVEYLSLEKVRFTPNGDLLFTSEVSYYETHQSRDRYYRVYFYENMIFAQGSPGQELNWMKKLPKQQRGGREERFRLIPRKNGGMYVLYVDNDKNLDLKENEKPAQHIVGRGGFLTAYELDQKGTIVDKFKITGVNEVKGRELWQFKLERIIPVDKGTFLIEFYKKEDEDLLVEVEL